MAILNFAAPDIVSSSVVPRRVVTDYRHCWCDGWQTEMRIVLRELSCGSIRRQKTTSGPTDARERMQVAGMRETVEVVL